MNLIRLNKLIAQRLNIGRRQADSLIERGLVVVDGKTAGLGLQVDAQKAHVVVDKKELPTESLFKYILFNKPVGYVCSRRQQGDNPTIYSLLPKEYQHLKPTGRLDKDSSGLLLLTNDGDLAFKMTHPKFEKTKVYEVALDKPLHELDLQKINNGLELPDGKSRLQLKKMQDDKGWQVTMHEGRNRQIRRTFAALGYEVIELHRTAFGPYQLDDLQPGKTKMTQITSAKR